MSRSNKRAPKKAHNEMVTRGGENRGAEKKRKFRVGFGEEHKSQNSLEWVEGGGISQEASETTREVFGEGVLSKV